MIKRVIDISEQAYLHVKNSQLVIEKSGEEVASIPIEDLGILILQHPAIVLTQQLIIACQKNKAIIIFCDEKHLPYSVILQITEGHSLHSKVLKQQVAISEPTRKRLWKEIVKNKIEQQALTLKLLGKESSRLNRLATEVKTGDSGNCEAVAAKAYWIRLFGEEFRRDVNMNGINALLNYGYAILRAAIARSICGAGMHPTLGLFHKNQYNPLCLADDLMEPFRPWIDYCVYMMVQNNELEINKNSKKVLLGLLNESVICNGNRMPFMVSMHYLTANLKRCYESSKEKLIFPQLEIRLSV